MARLDSTLVEADGTGPPRLAELVDARRVDMMTYITYILINQLGNKTYVGHTNNKEARRT